MAVVEQNLDGGALAVTEHEGTAGHRVLFELFAAGGVFDFQLAFSRSAPGHWGQFHELRPQRFEPSTDQPELYDPLHEPFGTELQLAGGRLDPMLRSSLSR